jgi:GT2 family glycosyltransferase
MRTQDPDESALWESPTALLPREQESEGEAWCSNLVVVVVEHARHDLTRLLLESLVAQCQVILVRTSPHPNAQPQGVLAVIDRPDNPGYAEAANEGLKLGMKLGFQFLLVANNDLMFGPRAIVCLRDTLTANPMIGAVSPVITFYPDTDQVWFAGGSLHGDMLIPVHRDYMKPVGEYAPLATSEFLSGCALCVRGEVLRDVGLLPEGYFMYFEDVEWSLRMRRRGWHLGVVGNATAHHWATASSGGLRGRAPSPLCARMMAKNPWLVRRRLRLGLSFLVGQVAIRLPYYVFIGLLCRRPSASLAYVRGFVEGITCSE